MNSSEFFWIIFCASSSFMTADLDQKEMNDCGHRLEKDVSGNITALFLFSFILGIQAEGLTTRCLTSDGSANGIRS